MWKGIVEQPCPKVANHLESLVLCPRTAKKLGYLLVVAIRNGSRNTPLNHLGSTTLGIAGGKPHSPPYSNQLFQSQIGSLGHG